MNPKRRRMLADGLIAGVVGYGTVVVFFALWNLAAGRSPVYTAGLLGAALFDGLRDPALLALEPGMVLAFNGVHMAAFLAFGFFAAWLVYEAELHPEFWYLAFFFFLSSAVLSYAAVLALSSVVGNLLSPWLAVASTMLGALGVAAYLAGSHRALIRAVRTSDGRFGMAE